MELLPQRWKGLLIGRLVNALFFFFWGFFLVFFFFFFFFCADAAVGALVGRWVGVRHCVGAAIISWMGADVNGAVELMTLWVVRLARARTGERQGQEARGKRQG